MSHVGPVDGLVLAAGRGERLGLGPKAWLTLGGQTLLERAVAVMREVCERVIVGVPSADVERAGALCGAGATVIAGGATHRDTMLAAFAAGDAPLCLLHDVAHPFLTRELARRVLDSARRGGAAVAAVLSASSAYHAPQTAARTRLGPNSVWLVRRPFACRRADLAQVAGSARGDDGLSVVLERAGVHTSLVAAPAWHIKVTTADDWALAQAIERSVRPM
jgi:2-C-methyl-D-erythritol 4-phosphate cytidylyltransferase